MPLTLEIITGERVLLRQENVTEVIAPGTVGELGILPNHAALVTSLGAGDLRVGDEAVEECCFITRGFLEVIGDGVSFLADAAERGDEIDLERAEEARQRAEQRLHAASDTDRMRAEAALQRSLVRLRVAERRRRRGGRADLPSTRGGA